MNKTLELYKFLREPKKGQIVKVYDEYDRFLSFGKVVKITKVKRSRKKNGELEEFRREIAVCEKIDYEPKEINFYLPYTKVKFI